MRSVREEKTKTRFERSRALFKTAAVHVGRNTALSKKRRISSLILVQYIIAFTVNSCHGEEMKQILRRPLMEGKVLKK